MPGEFLLRQFLRVIGKGRQDVSHLLAGHVEERPIISQPQCRRCHRACIGQASLEVFGEQRTEMVQAEQ